jgi:hypothetical protein
MGVFDEIAPHPADEVRVAGKAMRPVLPALEPRTTMPAICNYYFSNISPFSDKQILIGISNH